MYAQLSRLQPRLLGLVFGATLGLTLLAAYLYVLKKPVAEYRRHQQTRLLLEGEVRNGAGNSEEIQTLTAAVEALERQLLSGSDAVPVNQMVAHIIGQLDRISSNHQVELIGVKPGQRKKVFMFEEVPFEVEIKGGYFSLYDWLREVEQELGPMVVKQFTITPEAPGDMTRIRLTVVSYRPLEGES